MPICPTCNATYPPGTGRCPADGAVLTSAAEQLGSFATMAAREAAAPGVSRSRPGGTRVAGSTPSPATASRPGAAATPAPTGRSQPPAPPASAVSLAPRLTPLSGDQQALRDVSLPSGELLAGAQVGEYEVTGKLGEGGMGMVFSGIQPVIGKRVAIKVLAPELAKNPEVTLRFITEARAVNQIGHRNIVDIFSFGQLPDGRHYFVMEYVDGEILSARLARTGVMPFEEGFRILLEVCDALNAAHQKGIVHRDLKPDNVYLAAGTQTFAKLLDFGIAKLTGPEGALTKTRTGMPIGTPLYMSPEQCRGVAVDHRTDLYALGIMMYEMFTGRTPFQGESYVEVITAHLSAPPPAPSQFAEIPAAFEAIILKALAKNPDDRYQTAAELAEALQAVRAALPSAAPAVHAVPLAAPPAGSAAYSSAAGTTPAPAAVSPAPAPRKKPVLALALVAVVVVGAGGVMALALRRERTPDQPVAVTPVITPGSLWVEASEPGAEVEVDGVKKGPAPVRLAVTRGEPHVLIVAKSGFKSFTDRFTLTPQAPERHAVAKLEKLELPRGTVTVGTGRTDAVVTMDGKEVGRGSRVTIEGVTADVPHQIRVEAEGREPAERSVSVAVGAVRGETFSLKRTHRAARPVAAVKPKEGGTQPLPAAKPVKRPAGTEETLKPW